MDKAALKSKAENLERELAVFSGDNEVDALKAAVVALIENAKSGRIDGPLQWRDIPGGRLFSEGNLRRHAALERAWSAFCVELTGGESDVLRALKADMQSR